MTLLVYLPALSASSQVLDNQMIKLLDEFDELKRINVRQESSYEGTPYLYEEYIPGDILMTDGRSFFNIPLRYNTYSNHFEFKNDSTSMEIGNSPDIALIRINSKEFIYSDFHFLGRKETGYLERLVNGSYSLFLLHRTILRKAQEGGAYQEAKKPTFVSQRPDYLIGSPNGKVIKVNSIKDLAQFGNEIEYELASYSGKKKLRLKKEIDYIKLVSYLNDCAKSN